MAKNETEDKIAQFSRWVYRNLLASGVFIACAFFLYNHIEGTKDDLKDEIKELRMVLLSTAHIQQDLEHHMATRPMFPVMEVPEEASSTNMERANNSVKQFMEKYDYEFPRN